MQIKLKNDHIAVISPDTMGEGISEIVASAGHPFLFCDVSKIKLQKVIQKISQLLNILYKKILIIKK